MADTYTPLVRLQQPTVNADNNTWGNILDTDLSLIDSAITGVATVSIAGLTSYTLKAANGQADQARNPVWIFTGALAGDCTVTIPASVKVGYAYNNTTGGHNVILTTGSGSTITLPPGVGWMFFYCDGTNVNQPTLELGAAAFFVPGTHVWTIAPDSSSNLNLTDIISGSVVLQLNASSGSLIRTASLNIKAPSGNANLYLDATSGGGHEIAVFSDTAGNLQFYDATSGKTPLVLNGSTGGSFANSFGLTSYQKLPNGYIRQFGRAQTDVNGDATVTFSIPFPNDPISIVATPYVYNGGHMYVMSFTTTTASFYMDNGSGSGVSGQFSWCAEGN